MKKTTFRVVRPDVENEFLHVFPREGVERAQRFVHEQHVRIAGQGAGQSHPLLHAAGQLVDRVVLEVRETHQRQILPRLRPARGAGHALELEAELGVLDDR